MKYCPHIKQHPRASSPLLVAIAAFVATIAWVSSSHAEKLNVRTEKPELSPACQAAVDSIAAETLRQHVYFLADDALQGRKPGTPGNREAAGHIAGEFEKYGLAATGINTADNMENESAADYFQPFSNHYHNVLAILPGSDPRLKKETIVIGAHYDHIGTNRSGQVCNGADDNASGIAGLLEVAEAFSILPTAPRRTILFAAWDGEESGLLGSLHWVHNPSPPDTKVVFMFNIDMIGRFREDKLSVHYSRSGFGLRRIISTHNSDITLDFAKLLWMGSDHLPFFGKGIPTIFFNTGRHEQLHKYNDDADLINVDGMQSITRLIFKTTNHLANADEVTPFRKASIDEMPLPSNKIGRKIAKMLQEHRNASCQATGDEIEESHLDNSQTSETTSDQSEKPLKLGIYWQEDDAEPGTVVLTQVAADMPAARAGLKPGDRIYRLNGKRFKDNTEFARRVKQAKGSLTMLVEYDGKLRSVEIRPETAARAQAE